MDAHLNHTISNTIKVSKRRVGRPYSPITKKALKTFARYPQISPKQLSQHLHIKHNHAKQLTHRYKPQNKHKNKSQIVRRENKHSQPLQHDIYSLLNDYIFHKEAQTKRFRNCLHDIFPDGYTINYDTPYRYYNELALMTKDNHGTERPCITRLKNHQTVIETDHIHKHNTRKQFLDYHIHDHDLVKFLCNYLGIEYHSRIYLGRHHFISTDASGLDVCHHYCLKKLLDTSIETGREGKYLLESTFIHGKLVCGNNVKFEW